MRHRRPRTRKTPGALILSSILFWGSESAQTSAQTAPPANSPKDASAATQKSNAAVVSSLPFADRKDFEAAKQGFIGSLEPLTIGTEGQAFPVWEKYAVQLQNGVLIYTENKQFPQANVTLTGPRDSFVGALFGVTTIDKEIAEGRLKIAGDQAKLGELFGLLETFDPNFNIVTP